MKRVCDFFAITLWMVSICLASSCTNDEDAVEVKEAVTYSISFSLPAAPQTRLAYTDEKEAGKGGSLQWSEYDQLHLYCYKEDGSYVGLATSEPLTNQQIVDDVASFTFLEGPLSVIQDAEVASVDAFVKKDGSGTFSTTYSTSNRKISFFGYDGKNQDEACQEQSEDDNAAGVGCLALVKSNMAKADFFNGTPIALEMGGSLIRFDLTNLPEDLGTLKQLTWQVDGNSGPSHLYNLKLDNLTISNAKRSCTLYMGFLPEDMTIKAGGGFHLTLEGDKTYTASKEVAAGMTYVAGQRYVAAIDNSDNTAVWTEEPSYTLAGSELTMNVAPGKLVTLINSITEDVSGVSKVVVKGVLNSNDMIKTGDFNPNDPTDKPNSSALSNWLRFTATNVASLDMSQVSGLTTLPENAFYGCGGNSVVSGNSSFNELLLPTSLRTIEGSVFTYSGIKSIALPEGVTTLKEFALSHSYITKVVIPSTVTTIENYAFAIDYNSSGIYLVFEGTNVDLLNKKQFTSSVLNYLHIMLPHITNEEQSKSVRSNCTISYSELYPMTYTPKVYYGWNAGTYSEASFDEKCNSTNYTTLP